MIWIRLSSGQIIATKKINEKKRYEFNGIFDTKTSVYEALKVVGNVANGSFNISDGKYSVIIDRERSTPVQHFTPRNSWGFKASKTFPQESHAIRARYVEPDQDWQQDEIIVYDDGYSEDNATFFQESEYFGVTDSSQAFRLGRFELAAKRFET